MDFILLKILFLFSTIFCCLRVCNQILNIKRNFARSNDHEHEKWCGVKTIWYECNCFQFASTNMSVSLTSTSRRVCVWERERDFSMVKLSTLFVLTLSIKIENNNVGAWKAIARGDSLNIAYIAPKACTVAIGNASYHKIPSNMNMCGDSRKKISHFTSFD